MSWAESEKLNEWIERAYQNGRQEEQDRIVKLLENQSFIWMGEKQLIQISRDDLITLIKGEKDA
jgi:hypothetical protein